MRMIRSAIFGAALVAGTFGAAEASSIWVPAGGSLKDDSFRGTLIPQAVAIPETKTWYLRGDVGWTVGNSADIELRSGPGQVWKPSSNYVLSFGAGKYLTPSWRGELLFDYRDRDKIFQTSTDILSLASYSGLVNVYYDFLAGSHFRPYLGAGLGMSLHQLERKTDIANLGNESKRIDNNYALAAAVMAGFAYEFDTGLWLDSNYRYMWQDADIRATAADGCCLSTIEIGSRHDHELRVGMRYDIW